MKLVYGLVSRTATYWLHYVAQTQGFYAAEGLEVEDVRTGSTKGGVNALAAGEVNIGSNCPDLVIAAVEQGADLAIVGGVIHRPVSAIVARAGIRDLGELQGQRVAMTDEQGGVSSLLRGMLRRVGLQPGDYVPVVVDGGTPVQAVALREGRVDAAMLTHPFESQLEREGFLILGSTADLWERYAFTTLNVRRDWAAANPDALTALLRATARAGRWLKDPARAAEAQSILAQATGLPLDHVEATYRRYIAQDDVLAWQGEIDPVGIQAVLKLMEEEGVVTNAGPVERYLLELPLTPRHPDRSDESGRG